MKGRTERQDGAAMAPERPSGGFTLVETLIAVGLSTIVIAGVLVLFVWVLRAASESRQYAWAQTEAVQSYQKVAAHMRNAMEVNAIDISGNWIELSMPPTGSVCRFSYVRSGPALSEGRLVFVNDVSDPACDTQVVAQGITKVMTPPSRNVFEQTGSNSVRVAYRINKPLANRVCPVEVDVGVRLRNY